MSVGTILVSREPFSSADLTTIENIAKKMQFDVALSPRGAIDATFEAIASGINLGELFRAFPINITAPTDDSPFFFNMLRMRDIFNRDLWDQEVVRINYRAVVILGILLITVFVLTLLCIIVPLILTAKNALTKNALPLLLYFACIGFGFIIIEISQMQRLIVFLGHPTYSLSVVLFSLLLSMGIGSYVSQDIINTFKNTFNMLLLLILLAVLVAFGLLTPVAINEFHTSSTIVRIGVAIGILSFLGFFMGTAFPIGMKVASNGSASLTPWLWGINGATSVCGSVLAMAIALVSGISTSFWVGVVFYTFAFCSCGWAIKGRS